jgi:hypothetical protein
MVCAGGFADLTPQQKEAHRAKIGLRAEAILGGFWRDDTPDAVRAMEIEGWIDALENCSHSEIRDAWATYQRHGPRSQSGRLVRPDAGALYRLIADARPKPRLVSLPAPDPEPDRKPLPLAKRIAISREVGFRVADDGHVAVTAKPMPGVKRARGRE